MRVWIVIFAFAATAAGAVGVAQEKGAAPDAAAKNPVPWAYNIPPAPPPGAKPAPEGPPDDGLPVSVPGSSQKFTRKEAGNPFGPGDWFPEDHPTMPEIVAKGRAPDVRSCALCHYANGRGKAENAPISGLPVGYFIQQMADYKNGLRKSGDPRKANTNAMIAIAKAMTDEEVKIAAEYFASVKWTPWIKVIETSTVPKTRSAGGLAVPLEGEDAGKEPIGMRIVEVPENVEQTLVYRNPRSGFIAYAPMGSIKKGQELVSTGGGGKTVRCATCHGADLKGIGPVPSIAGRSPSYVARQLYDFQSGARQGPWADLMKEAVAKLTAEDFVNITAYTASLAP
jgi:cytochrome c553